ncbi:hypothetical protein OG256_40010 [Streptomyces sp. NBC_00564]|nr:hypothetical protein OG256_40010 [Streptomyces sp. NBC_00564]
MTRTRAARRPGAIMSSSGSTRVVVRAMRSRIAGSRNASGSKARSRTLPRTSAAATV